MLNKIIQIKEKTKSNKEILYDMVSILYQNIQDEYIRPTFIAFAGFSGVIYSQDDLWINFLKIILFFKLCTSHQEIPENVGIGPAVRNSGSGWPS